MNATPFHTRTDDAPDDRADRAANARAAKSAAAAELGDWLTAAFVFAILGGCVALWLADLSLVAGAVAALASGAFGVLFADW